VIVDHGDGHGLAFASGFFENGRNGSLRLFDPETLLFNHDFIRPPALFKRRAKKEGGRETKAVEKGSDSRQIPNGRLAVQ
jgi:hypothetical protein